MKFFGLILKEQNRNEYGLQGKDLEKMTAYGMEIEDEEDMAVISKL